MAESLEANANATEWTVRLKPGLKFHNGKAVTAEDVAFSYRRVANPDAPFAGASGLKPLDLANLKVMDERTIRFPALAPYAGFPDLTHTIEEQIAEGEKVVNRLLIRGTHRGSFQGIPASGKAVAMPALTIQRIAEGKVAEQWIAFDAMGLLQQLGVMQG